MPGKVFPGKHGRNQPVFQTQELVGQGLTGRMLWRKWLFKAKSAEPSMLAKNITGWLKDELGAVLAW